MVDWYLRECSRKYRTTIDLLFTTGNVLKHPLRCRVNPGDRALTYKVGLVTGSIPRPGLTFKGRFVERWLRLTQD